MRLLRNVVCNTVHASAALRVSNRLDNGAAMAAIAAILAYRCVLSPFLGRQCLFCPTCSSRSILLFRSLGWNCGIAEVSRQLSRCCGDYKLRRSANGTVELETKDGAIFYEKDISQRLLTKFERDFQEARAGWASYRRVWGRR